MLYRIIHTGVWTRGCYYTKPGGTAGFMNLPVPAVTTVGTFYFLSAGVHISKCHSERSEESFIYNHVGKFCCK
jgi:hypothetical protein